MLCSPRACDWSGDLTKTYGLMDTIRRTQRAGVVRGLGRMHEANEACYTVVRRELRTLFGALCRNKSADIVFSGRKVRKVWCVVARFDNFDAYLLLYNL